MKVLELCLSPSFGGLEIYFARTYKYLVDSGIPCVAAVRPESLTAKYVTNTCDPAVGYPTVHFSPSSRYFPLKTAKQLAAFIDEHEIDVIHMHWAKDLVLAVLAKSRSKRKPKIVYTRQMAILGRKHDLYHRLVYSRVDKFVCITEEMRQQALDCLPIARDKVVTLYHGTPVVQTDSQFCRDMRSRFSIGDGDFVVGLVGRLEHHKGQHVLLRAIAKLVDSGVESIHAVIVGNGKFPAYETELERLTHDLKIEDKVHFEGYHPNPPKIMGCFDLVVLTTLHETFGLVLIEAMSAGVAVIGTNAGGVPEIIEDGVTGLLVEPGDVDGLAGAIQRLYGDKDLRARLANNGKERSKSKFNLEMHYQALMELLKSETHPRP